MWSSVLFGSPWSQIVMLKIILKWFLGKHRFRFKFKAGIGIFLEDKKCNVIEAWKGMYTS